MQIRLLRGCVAVQNCCLTTYRVDVIGDWLLVLSVNFDVFHSNQRIPHVLEPLLLI